MQNGEFRPKDLTKKQKLGALTALVEKEPAET
jgi:hypothetical protein